VRKRGKVQVDGFIDIACLCWDEVMAGIGYCLRRVKDASNWEDEDGG
jgi:hypothetical protein